MNGRNQTHHGVILLPLMFSHPLFRSARLAIPSAVLALSCLAQAQNSIASYSGLHAIVGARIEIGDGRVIEKGTVVIRDGMIVAVAADAAVPHGAEVLDGKGLTVYPGFIDGYSTKGFKAPASDTAKAADPDTLTSDFASAFMREGVRQGIHPDTRAVQNLSLSDDLLKSYRTAGFTTILVAPNGSDMSGIASLVNLSGRPTRECTVVANVGETAAFGGGGFGDSYPSSLMGHIAQLRQTFFDAQWYRNVERSFEAGGIQRPPSDDALIALQPVISARLPIIWNADNEYQIERSLNIAAEFGLKPMIAGGKEAWKRLDMLKKTGVPVLVSLGFGKDPSPAATPATPPTPPAKPPTPDAKAEPEPEKENPLKVAEKVRLYKESLKNASLLSAAGISFALSTQGSDNPTDFLSNLRKAVEAGLSKDVALRCLTIDAAKIFGVERQLGTIEVGKIANVIVLTGDFLKAETKVKILYIDGRKIDPSKVPIVSTPRFQFGSEGGN